MQRTACIQSDNAADWIYPKDLTEKIEKDMTFAVVPSRNHMRPKDGRFARPRFHMYFPHDPITDGDISAALKRDV